MNTTMVEAGGPAGVIAELEAVAGEARRAFGGLTAHQLNWKPSPESWSVAQCFDHVIKTNEAYFPAFDRLARGGSAGMWERLSPLSGFWGRFLVKTLSPESARKIKARPKFHPSASDVAGSIIEDFAAHQRRLADAVKALGGLDTDAVFIKSPVAGFVTYSLSDAFRIIAVHERRHFEQARRVTQTEGFPK